MKKIIVFLLAIIVVLQSHSQNSVRVGFSFHPGISGLTNRIETDNNIKGQIYEGARFSTFSNLYADYKLIKGLRLYVGLGYTILNFDFIQKKENYEPGFLEDVFPEMKFWINTEYTLKSFFYSLPMGISYDFKLNEKLIIQTKLGLCLNYLDYYYIKFDAYYTTLPKESRTDYFEEINTYMHNVDIGIGLNYALFPKLSFVFQPNLKYFIAKTDDLCPIIEGNYYNIRLEFGILYTFNP